MRQPAAPAARRRPRHDGAPRRGARRGHREGEDLRRAQPVRRRHAPAGAPGPLPGADAGSSGARRASPSARSRRRRSTSSPTARRRSASRRRRRRRTTATRSSRSPRLARYQQAQAEEGGAYVLTETSATQLLVEDGEVHGVRTGDKGRGKDGEPLGNFEPGTDVVAKATVLAEGCWGHLTGAAIREFDLAEGREPQVWELGVKEVWKVPKPLDRVIHTLGRLAAEDLGQVRPDRRLVDLPDEGREDRRRPRLDRLRHRPRLRRRHDERARPAPAVQDAPARQGHPRGRRARRLGRQGDPGRRLLGDAQADDARRADRRRRRRHGQPGRAEGRPLRDPLGHPRRGVDLRVAQARAARTSRATSRRSRTRRSARTSGSSATRASRSRRASSRAGRWST